MKKKSNLYLIEHSIIIDNLKPFRKIGNDLYIVKLDCNNKSIIEYYSHIQNDKRLWLKGLYDDYIVIDSYGKVFGLIIVGEDINIAIKKILKNYKLWKRHVDYDTYKIKQLMKYVAYKIKIGEY